MPVIDALIVIANGDAADLPSSAAGIAAALNVPVGDIQPGIQFFCNDTGNLYVWNGVAMVQIGGPAEGFTNPMDASGDMIYEDPSLGPARLPIGTSGEVLTVVNGIPTWAAAAQSTNFEANGSTLSSDSTINFEGDGTYITVSNPSAGNVKSALNYSALVTALETSLDTTFDAFGAAGSALSAAEAYANGLASNYDAAGAAAAAQSNAENYATSAVATETARAEAEEAMLASIISGLGGEFLALAGGTMSGTINMNENVIVWENASLGIDTSLSRVAAGVLGIGTGAQGSVAGGLELNTLQILDSGANVDLLLKNTTAATALTTNASPLLELAVFYDNGGVFTGLDTWSVGSSIAAGSNGASTLTLKHSGSTGLPQISHNSSSFVSTYAGTYTMGSTGGTCTIESGSGSTLQFQPAGTLTHALFGTYMHLANISIGWQPGTTISGNNVDINIARISPAVLGVGIQETSAPLAVAGGVGGSIQATGFYSFGGLVLEQAPSVVGTPTITPTGGSATHYSYEVVALDINMQPIGASAAGSTTTGVATLTTSAFNTVTWTAVQGAFAYAVYRSASSGTPSTTGLLYGSTTLTSVAIATAGYSATYSYASTAINAKLIGQYVLVQGAANAANSGLFYCLSATATSCVLINPYAVAEASSPASATLSSGYVPAIPSGGAALTALTFVDYGWTADGTTAPTTNTHGGISWLSTYESSATGPALSLDRWTAYQSVATGLNGASTLDFVHKGSTGLASLSAPNINAVTAYYANGTVGITQTAEAVGTLATTGGIVTTFTAVSDERLKNASAYEGGLDEVLAITPIKFRWNETGAKYSGQSTERDFIGFSAQDVRKVIPEATWISKDDYLGFDDRPVIAALVNAVKELKAEIEKLKAKQA